MRLLASAVVIAVTLAVPCPGDAQVVNGSFETGDYTGWDLSLTVDEIGNTYAVVADGTTVDFNDSLFDHLSGGNEPQTSLSLPQTYFATDGTQLAVVLSNGLHVGRMFQDVLVPTGNPTLEWDMSWVNSDMAFDPAEQYIEVSVRDPANDAMLASLFKTTEGVDPLVQPMAPFSASLAAYAGQTVRIDITSRLQYFYCDFAIDNIRFGVGGVCGDGTVDSGEDCDDSGESATCDADCTFAVCGDGVHNLSASEECDDGNVSEGDACNALCGLDTDADGISDLDEVDDTDLATPPPDTDFDTIADYLDEDSDNDGILDIDEAGDADPTTPPVDSDLDGVPDFRDDDSDDDGVPDFIEAGDPDPLTPPVDTDGDLVPDFLDTDSDDDTVGDGTDNCPLVRNADQLDTDGDGIGDACAPLFDTDADGVPDVFDNCPLVRNADQLDTDGDGIGDACTSLDDPDSGVPDSDAGVAVDGGGADADAGTSDDDGGQADGGNAGDAPLDPEQVVFGGGGGCAAGGQGGGPGWFPLALVLGLLVLRRRGLPWGLGSLLVAHWAAAPSTARAQVAVEEDVQIDRFVLAGDRNGILNVEWGAVSPHLDWDASVSFGALGSPLVARFDGEERPLVSSRYSAALNGSIGLWDWTELILTLPFVVFQKGDDIEGFDNDAVGSTAVGDLRIAPKIQLLKQSFAGFDLAIIPALTLPTSAGGGFSGEKTATFSPQIAGSVTVDGLRLSANLGFLVRKNAQFGAAEIGDELTTNVGVGYRFGAVPLELDVSALLAFPVGNDAAQADRNYAELLGGGTYWLTDSLALFAAAGRGLTGGIGSPDWRALFGLRFSRRTSRPRLDVPALKTLETVVLLPDEDGHVGAVEVDDGVTTTVLDTPYASTALGSDDSTARVGVASKKAVEAKTGPLAAALPPVDNDRDGIPDANDGCPSRPGPASTDPLRHGCPSTTEKVVVVPDPDGHVGAVEVDDGTTTTLLDAAYATSEVGAGGVATRVAATPAAAVSLALTSLGAAALTADLDGDGVPDESDLCPERPGAASTDPLRQGCPPAAERIVVLPDADGHVGAVEVDDGTTQVIVDTAYAGAELGTGGSVVSVAPAPAEVVDRAVARYAAALPPLDADSDGVPDSTDACPARPGVISRNALRHGCPRVRETVILLPGEAGEVGSLEIDDGTGITVIDEAFATFEVGPDGESRPVVTSSGPAVRRSTADVAAVLPRADGDGDGVIDAHDACKERPGATHVNGALNGCPPSMEKIVLLPDDDGHVGALEVGEGSDAFVLDTAYATAEIAEDGKAVRLRTPPTTVEQEFRETFAARPDYSGARIVIYFDNRAEPTLDVSEQVEDLVADLYGRVGYSVSVVGHTDETGSRRHNQKVGLARAQRVADDLMAAGVPEASISVVSKGSSEPAVRVSDPSIPELKNRRVEIFVTY